MDSSYFKAVDKVAFEKHALDKKRREELEPPPPPPSNADLWGSRIVKPTDSVKTENERLAAIKRGGKVTNHPSASTTSTFSTAASTGGKSTSHITEANPYLDDKLGTPSSLTLLKARRKVAVTNEGAREWLTSRGFDCDLVRKPIEFGWTPFHQAVEESNLGMMAWLYDNGASADLRTVDDGGLSVLSVASMRRDLPVTRWLYSHGAADVYSFDPNFDAFEGF